MKSLLFLPIFALCSCSTPAQNAKLAAIGNLALSYAEAKGAITPADAALVREAGVIALAPEPALPVTNITVVDVTGSK